MAEDTEEHPIINDRTRIMKATVSRASRLTPHIAEVTLAGPDLRTCPDIGPDQFVYVFVPHPGETAPAVEHDFSWETWRHQPEAERAIGRYYTVRRLRQAEGEMDLLMVLHGDGPLTTWAASAKPGDAVALWGPRAAYHSPEEGRPVVLACDAAGLPALAAIVERLPAEASGHAFVELDYPDDRIDLACPEDVSLTWLCRGDAPRGEKLFAAVAALSIAPETYAWVAAENEVTTRIRRRLRTVAGLPGTSVCAVGYWQQT